METISIFDIFKVGVGPSSSHTIGPWKAAVSFINSLKSKNNKLPSVKKIEVELYGSLSKTGVGHGTHIAAMMGLLGKNVEEISTEEINSSIENIKNRRKLLIQSVHEIDFNSQEDIIFNYQVSLEFHPNALEFRAFDEKGKLVLSEIYYSIGGGFIVKDGDLNSTDTDESSIPYPVFTGVDLIKYCDQLDKTIDEVTLLNEKAWHSEQYIDQTFDKLVSVMKESIYHGCHTDGILPGGLNVKRRAQKLSKRLLKTDLYKSVDDWFEIIKTTEQTLANVTDWVTCFALAVNEVNASFGRIVTAPTNGAAGVIPAVLFYQQLFTSSSKEEDIKVFLLTAGEIGCLFKKGATISAAAGGCQAEIGVSSAMAAAGLTATQGGSPKQCLMAAEIAMEHHLGMTCDPIGGLVQIPCIERNSMGAMKAITASQLALNSNPDDAKVSLDSIIKTMLETAKDMSHKYKETAEGGLATNVIVHFPDC